MLPEILWLIAAGLYAVWFFRCRARNRRERRVARLRIALQTYNQIHDGPRFNR